MATLRELIIKISANSQSFQTEISRASRMGQDYYRTMQNGGRQAAAAARESERALSIFRSMAGRMKRWLTVLLMTKPRRFMSAVTASIFRKPRLDGSCGFAESRRIPRA